MKIKTISEAFAAFDAKPLNPVWSWSAISRGKSHLVLTIWSDQYQINANADYLSFVWSNFGCDNHLWAHKLGNRYRIRDIKYALEHFEGKFKAIKVVADPDLIPERKILRCHPLPHEWKITEFNPDTGECAAVSLPVADQAQTIRCEL